ncbi:MAG TPA: hypothetical protein VJN18_16175 [Polyangiaceae bacterium]|nr:hypothetical protein [Polyangiaceae bacterium]
MRLSNPLLLASLGALVAVASCTLITDVDRSKIPDGQAGTPSSSGGDGSMMPQGGEAPMGGTGNMPMGGASEGGTATTPGGSGPVDGGAGGTPGGEGGAGGAAEGGAAGSPMAGAGGV